MTKNNGVRILIAAAFFLAMAVGAYAQQDEVAAQVPFDFVVGGRTLPAGAYTIARASGDQLAMLSLHGEPGAGTKIYAMTEFNSPEEGEKLVFHRYGTRYFLSEVWTARGRHVLTRSKEETRLARGLEPAVVAIAPAAAKADLQSVRQ